MKTTAIIDIIVAAVLLGFTAAGGRRGLFRALSGLLIVVVALVGASAAAKAASPAVTDFLRPYLEQRVAARVDSALDGSASLDAPDESAAPPDAGGPGEDAPVIPVEPQISGAGGEEDLLTRLQAGELLKLMGLDEHLRDSLAGQVEKTVRDTGVSILSAIAENLVGFLVYTVLFALCFAALVLVLRVVAGALNLALKLPGLHLLNTLGGAAIGLVEGALLLFLAIWVLRSLGVSFETETVAQTQLLRFFAEHGPLDLLLLS